jgi:hypothetical protein
VHGKNGCVEDIYLVNFRIIVHSNLPFPISEEEIKGKIYLIRGCRVMFDSDLAELYDVET